MMVDSIRTFVAINLDVASIRRVAELVARGRALSSAPKASWEPPTRLHVTICFLGEMDAGLVPAIGDVMRAAVARCAVGGLGLGPIGAFPGLEAARVVFAEVGDEGGVLSALRGAVSEGLSELGFEEEQRPFVPHLTLARCRGPSDLRGWIGELGPIDLGPARATECVLYRSDMGRPGGEYTALERLAVQAASAAPRQGKARPPPRGQGGRG
jgi:RNA 2',3'-cyclic 3'-phosphodiesterase